MYFLENVYLYVIGDKCGEFLSGLLVCFLVFFLLLSLLCLTSLWRLGTPTPWIWMSPNCFSAPQWSCLILLWLFSGCITNLQAEVVGVMVKVDLITT